MTDEKLSYGSAESEQPLRAWSDSLGGLVLGPFKTSHNMHYAKIDERGILSFFASRADMANLTPMVSPYAEFAEDGVIATRQAIQGLKLSTADARIRELESDVSGVEWTRDPIPEGETMGMPNVGHYFFAELHKGDWLLSLRDAWNTGGYKPNTPHWMRSQMIIFPDPPTGEGEES